LPARRSFLSSLSREAEPDAEAKQKGMSNTTASLRRKIGSAGDLQSVVRTMKALAASNIGQYEQSVRALADYARSVELGLSICFRKIAPAAQLETSRRVPQGAPQARSCSARTRDWWAGSTTLVADMRWNAC
jgi:hypothetical protein